MASESFTTQDLIEELRQYHPPIEQRSGGVTRQEFAKEQGIIPQTAGEQLNKLCELGVLYRLRQRCEDGFVRFVYYKNSGED